MTKRTQQVSEKIKHEIARLIVREIEMPQDSMVTVTRVQVSGELDYAKIWLSILPAESAEDLFRMLIKQRKNIQSLLTQELDMRKSPKISFVLDTKAQEAFAMEELLDRIKKEDYGN